MTETLKPIQTGGMCHLWQNVSGSFKHLFLKLDLRCEPDRYPGIVIVANANCGSATASKVDNLSRELPALLQAFANDSVVYWSLQPDVQHREEIFIELTQHPVFIG